MAKLNRRTFKKSERVVITTFNEKAMFPMSGKGHVVNKVVMPTMNRGSQTTLLKRFKTRREADAFFNRLKAKNKSRNLSK